MARPLFSFQVSRLSTYWAPWGEDGWSAVLVIRLGRTRVRVERVNPKTQVAAKTKGWTRLDELLKRDPKQAGADRPEEGPAIVFKEVREARANKAAEAFKLKAQAEEAPPEPLAEEAPRERVSEDRIGQVLDLAADQYSEEDW